MRIGDDKKRFQAVIFDLDGTLLDTLEDIGDAVNQMLAESDFPGHLPEAYRRFIGNGIKKLVERALPETERSAPSIDTCVKRAREIYWENWNRKTRPYKGVESMLNGLETGKVPKAVLSNKPHDFTVRYVDAYFPTTTFQVVMGQTDAFPVKPDPSSALDIAKRMGLPPSAFLFVGDSAADVKAALSAGMHPIGVSWGFKGPEALVKAGCETVVDHPSEILQFIPIQEG